jgi:hypothetical protein
MSCSDEKLNPITVAIQGSEITGNDLIKKKRIKI